MMGDRERLEEAVAALEAQRALLGEGVVATALAALREQLAALDAAAAPPDQRRLVTVLFADLVDFTEMAAAMDAEEVRDLMDSLWRRLDGIITSFSGQIDKHMGDGVMALFGTPVTREDDPERAIRAALAMQAAMRALEEEPGQAPFRLRIGISSGLVFLGAVGTTGEHTAMGDTVNLASRLEQAAPPGGILIAQETERLVRGIFDVEALPPLAVKGKAEPQHLYRVRGEQPRTFTMTTRGIEGIEARMVGRADEMSRLQAAFHTVVARREPQVATIVGEAGVGKSRLILEFCRWLDTDVGDVRIVRGRADQQMQRIPYALIRTLLASQLGIRESDRAALVHTRFEEMVARHLGPETALQAHLIGHLVGFDFSESPLLPPLLADARRFHEQARAALAALFQAATRIRPSVFCFDDIHWADDPSLEVITTLADGCRGSPLLIICLSRPSLFEQYPGWGEALPGPGPIWLQPLTSSESALLVVELLQKGGEIPAVLRETIVNRAEGNPYYVEELIKMFIEEGVIVKGEESWHVEPARLAGTRTPTTLTGVIQARLDALPYEERELLQRAAVMGRTFWLSALAALSDASARGAPDPAPLVQRLLARELIFQQPSSSFGGTTEFIFKHTLLQEVAYERLLLRQRRRYHAQVAAWLIEQGGERTAEQAGLIAEHYERAGESILAAEWLVRAGQKASASYVPRAAISYFQKALDFLPDHPEMALRRVALYEQLGRVLVLQTHYAEALEIFEAMRLAARTAQSAGAEAQALSDLSRTRSVIGDQQAALALAEAAERMARQVDDPSLLALMLYRRGLVLYRMGRLTEAQQLGEEALARSRALGDHHLMLPSLKLLGWVHALLGHVAASDEVKQQALALAREMGDRWEEAIMLNSLGENARMRGDYAVAIPLYERAMEIAREIRDRDNELIILNNLGGAQVGLGDYAAAEAGLRALLGHLENPDWFVLPETYTFLARACLGQGRVAAALDAIYRALALATRMRSESDLAHAWRVMGLVRADAPASTLDQPLDADLDLYLPAIPAEAADCFAESARIFARIEAEGERARTLSAWATHEQGRGNVAAAAALRAEAQAIFTALGLEHELAWGITREEEV